MIRFLDSVAIRSNCTVKIEYICSLLRHYRMTAKVIFIGQYIQASLHIAHERNVNSAIQNVVMT